MKYHIYREQLQEQSQLELIGKKLKITEPLFLNSSQESYLTQVQLQTCLENL